MVIEFRVNKLIFGRFLLRWPKQNLSVPRRKQKCNRNFSRRTKRRDYWKCLRNRRQNHLFEIWNNFCAFEAIERLSCVCRHLRTKSINFWDLGNKKIICRQTFPFSSPALKLSGRRDRLHILSRSKIRGHEIKRDQSCFHVHWSLEWLVNKLMALWQRNITWIIESLFGLPELSSINFRLKF